MAVTGEMQVRIASIASGNEFFAVTESDASTLRSVEAALRALPVPVAVVVVCEA